MLSQTYPEFREHFLRYLQTLDAVRNSSICVGYPSYFGHSWASLIHIGLLAAAYPKAEYVGRLQEWQENSFNLSMIGPHFNLSRDYDDFIILFAGPLWALIAALMHDLPEAGPYIAKQCRFILSGMEDGRVRPEYSIPFALWMLHVAASSPLAAEDFERARRHINEHGGVSAQLLYNPQIHYLDDPYKPDSPREVPELREFIQGYGATALDPMERRSVAIALGINALVSDEEFLDVMPMQLMQALSGRTNTAVNLEEKGGA